MNKDKPSIKNLKKIFSKKVRITDHGLDIDKGFKYAGKLILPRNDPRINKENSIAVCALKEGVYYFMDDEFGECYLCEKEIRYRPDAPKVDKRICVKCFSQVLPQWEINQ